MKRTLLSVALASAASTVYAGTLSQSFSWLTTAVPSIDTSVATVPGFNPALGTLTGVNINLAGDFIVGSAVVDNHSPTTASSFQLFLSGIHHTTVNGFDIANAISLTSPTTLIPANSTGTAGPVSQALGGTLPGGLSGWVGPVSVLIRFNGVLIATANPPVDFISDPLLTSQGQGSITYTYTDTTVPEAGTYVAGLALAGVVIYGWYRRCRKA